MGQSRYFPPNCEKKECPLHMSCGRVPTHVITDEFTTPGENPVDFMIVGDYSSMNEMSLRAPFLEGEGQILKKIVQDTIPNKSVAYTYLVRGWPVDWATVPEQFQHQNLTSVKSQRLDRSRTKPLSNHPQRAQIISYCQDFFKADIQRLRPKMIVAMGNLVLETLFYRESRSVSKLTDEVLNYEGIPVRFISSPGVMIRNPSARAGWENQLKAILTGRRAERDTTLGSAHLISSLPEALEYIEMLQNTENDVAVDSETKNLNKRHGNLLGTIQFAESNGGAVVLPYLHAETPFTPDDMKVLNQKLFELFSVPNKIKRWVAHNAKFECNIFRSSFGTVIRSAPIFDTQVGAFLLDENRTERSAEFKYGIYTLKQLALDYLNFDGYDSGILKHREEGSLIDLPMKDLISYAAMDGYITRRLMYAELEEARKQDYTYQLLNLMASLVNRQIHLFSDIEYNGSPVDLKHTRTLISGKSPLLTRIQEINDELRQNPKVSEANDKLLQANAPTGRQVIPLGRKPWHFDFARTGHPQKLFFDTLGLPIGKVGKSLVPSVDSDWQEVNKANPLVALYMDWILMRKMYDSFAKSIYEYVDPSGTHIDHNTDCRVRPGYLISSVVTGRGACRSPNLQAIPRAENKAKQSIKNMFTAIPGHVMIQLDFKANEMRWVGILAQDHNMAKKFIMGKEWLDTYRKTLDINALKKAHLYGDIHKQNAAAAFKKPIEEVTKDERQKAKGISFGVLYDSSYKSVSELYNIPYDDVALMFENFYAEFHAIKEWKVRMKNMAQQLGYVETPHGRRRRFPIFDLYREANGYFNRARVPREQNMMIEEALRQASNAPVQGVASDAAAIGTAIFSEYIHTHKKPWFIQNSVHDSAVFQVPYSDLDEALVISERCFSTDLMQYMTDAFGINFILPLETEFEIGLRWGELIKWDFAKEELDTIKANIQREMAEVQDANVY